MNKQIGKKNIASLGNLDVIINALKSPNKITKFGLDFEPQIDKRNFEKLMNTLTLAHSADLTSLSFGKFFPNHTSSQTGH